MRQTRHARSITLGVAAVLSVLLCPLIAAAPEERLDLTAAEWRQDLREFAAQLVKRHAKPFHFVSQEAFDRAVAATDSAIAGLDGPGVVVRLMRLAAMIGDGHTALHVPKSFAPYPLGLRRFGDDFRVVRVQSPADSALGAKLVAIDDTPVAAVAASLDGLIAQDELPALRDAETPGFMTNAGLLHGAGVVKDERAARFTLENDRGERFTLTLAPGTTTAPWRTTTKEVPLYRRRPEGALAFTWLPDSRTVYCNWRNYEGLGGQAKSLWEFVDAHPTDRLVIDMRLNGGGDYHVGDHTMIDPVLKRPAINQEGHLFVIIGPITFSAALANAIHFRDQTKAMLVGEPIGEKPNSWSENDEFTLTRSHVTVSYSTKYYAFSPADSVIVPKQRIAPTWEEFRDGRDPVLEWIVACCR